MSFHSQGQHTYKIPMTLFRNNRMRVVEALKASGEVRDPTSTYILLQGGTSDAVGFYDTDTTQTTFRQESYFTYLFGVVEPNYYGMVRVSDGYTTIFRPCFPLEYEVWMGPIPSDEETRKKYEVDDVVCADKILDRLEYLRPSVLLMLKGVNSDSGKTYEPPKIEGLRTYCDYETLYPIISECRVFKSPEEIAVLRYVARVTSEAHKKVMRIPFLKTKTYEYQAEAVFLAHTYYVGGCRHCSYTCVCGVGSNAAVLHYGHAAAPNNREVRNGDMCLFDMGANYFGYSSDVTCSFPANGKFTPDQKLIYNAVLEANLAVQRAARDGVNWVDMHLLANRVMLGILKDGGLLKGDVNEMIAAGLNAVFQPHGLGHLIGLDIHDVGGYLTHCPKKPTQVGLTKLRFARDLKAGMYVTIEPGCYFIKPLLTAAYENPAQSKFLVKENLDRFWNFGGVRIEGE